MAYTTNKFNVVIPNGSSASNTFSVHQHTEFLAFLTGFAAITGTISLQVSLDGGTNWTAIITGVSGFFQGVTSPQQIAFLRQPGALFRLFSNASEAASRTMIILTYGEY